MLVKGATGFYTEINKLTLSKPRKFDTGEFAKVFVLHKSWVLYSFNVATVITVKCAFFGDITQNDIQKMRVDVDLPKKGTARMFMARTQFNQKR